MQQTNSSRKRQYSSISAISSGKITPHENLENSIDNLISQYYRYKNIKIEKYSDDETTADSVIASVKALIDLSEFNESDSDFNTEHESSIVSDTDSDSSILSEHQYKYEINNEYKRAYILKEKEMFREICKKLKIYKASKEYKEYNSNE